ncbi:MAG: hypothetical protein HQM01_04955 [Magnetococcales bacterium]|nr:hypothetical protein [Magnetococcales bacterium]
MSSLNSLRAGPMPTTLDGGQFMASRSAVVTVGDTTINYTGIADPGSSPSDACWLISRVTVNADGSTVTEFPNGNASFDQIWNNHASLSYS